jgi:tetratricopeptide (TPR) repeat protein
MPSANTQKLRRHLLENPSDTEVWSEISIVLGLVRQPNFSHGRHDPLLAVPEDDWRSSSNRSGNAEVSTDSGSDRNRKNGQSDLTFEQLQRGVFVEPVIADHTPEGIFQRAKQLVDDEQFESAIGLVEEWMGSAAGHTGDSMLAFIRAHAYRKLGRAAEALPILDPFRQEDTIPWIPFELGLIYKDLGRADEAYLCFRQARGIQPDFTWATIEAARTTQDFDVALGRRRPTGGAS